MMTDRPKALITAPFGGAGLARMRELVDVTLDPWIDQQLPEKTSNDFRNVYEFMRSNKMW